MRMRGGIGCEEIEVWRTLITASSLDDVGGRYRIDRCVLSLGFRVCFLVMVFSFHWGGSSCQDRRDRDTFHSRGQHISFIYLLYRYSLMCMTTVAVAVLLAASRAYRWETSNLGREGPKSMNMNVKDDDRIPMRGKEFLGAFRQRCDAPTILALDNRGSLFLYPSASNIRLNH